MLLLELGKALVQLQLLHVALRQAHVWQRSIPKSQQQWVRPTPTPLMPSCVAPSLHIATRLHLLRQPSGTDLTEGFPMICRSHFGIISGRCKAGDRSAVNTNVTS